MCQLKKMLFYYDHPTPHIVDCTFLSDRHSEGLAHLLASVHLHLRKRPDTRTSNTAYQYFTERWVRAWVVWTWGWLGISLN